MYVAMSCDSSLHGCQRTWRLVLVVQERTHHAPHGCDTGDGLTLCLVCQFQTPAPALVPAYMKRTASWATAGCCSPTPCFLPNTCPCSSCSLPVLCLRLHEQQGHPAKHLPMLCQIRALAPLPVCMCAQKGQLGYGSLLLMHRMLSYKTPAHVLSNTCPCSVTHLPLHHCLCYAYACVHARAGGPAGPRRPAAHPPI